jgi:hypothetical protein
MCPRHCASPTDLLVWSQQIVPCVTLVIVRVELCRSVIRFQVPTGIAMAGASF